MLTALLLLISLKSLSQAIDFNIPSTGELLQSDTTVTIGVDWLRNANVKLIERIAMKSILEIKEDQIKSYQTALESQRSINAKYILKLNNANDLNDKLKEDINRYKNVLYVSIPVCVVVGIILGIIIN